MFNIVSEEKILFASEAFKNLGDVTLCKGNRLTAQDLKYVDILLIRSGTRVDHSLLEGTPVQFVASATVGTDHVDRMYLAERGIPFYHAPGCNAESVVEYVISALFTLASRKKVVLKNKTVGIVGAGNIGGRLAERLPVLGMNVIVNDPPLQESENPTPLHYVTLEELLKSADIVTLHTPLEKEGLYPTLHLMDEGHLSQMKPDAWLINASRGAVLNNQDLKSVRSRGHLGAVVLDVWEKEPLIDAELMGLVDIATPHIAGHSFEGKVNGTIQVYKALTNHYEIDGKWDPQSILKPTSEDQLQLSMPGQELDDQALLHSIIKQAYDIAADDRLFRPYIEMQDQEKSAYFLRLRKDYPRRRTFGLHELEVNSSVTDTLKEMLSQGLRFKTKVIA